jgi:hypothetical protein
LRGHPTSLLTRASPVVKRDPRGLPEGLGTSSYIGSTPSDNALLLTARHVVRDLEHTQASAFVMTPVDPAAESGAREFASLRVTHICGAPDYSDMAILITEAPPVLPFLPTVDPRCPSLASTCLALGYSAMTLDVERRSATLSAHRSTPRRRGWRRCRRWRRC